MIVFCPDCRKDMIFEQLDILDGVGYWCDICDQYFNIDTLEKIEKEQAG